MWDKEFLCPFCLKTQKSRVAFSAFRFVCERSLNHHCALETFFLKFTRNGMGLADIAFVLHVVCVASAAAVKTLPSSSSIPVLCKHLSAQSGLSYSDPVYHQGHFPFSILRFPRTGGMGKYHRLVLRQRTRFHNCSRAGV